LEVQQKQLAPMVVASELINLWAFLDALIRLSPKAGQLE